MTGVRALRAGVFSVVWRPRPLLVGMFLVILGTVVFTVGLGLGSYPLSPTDVWRILLGRGTEIERTVVWDLRLGRAVVALLVGACLGFSGALTQTVARNPLASPDILGVTHGASFAAVGVIAFAGTGGVLGDSAGLLLGSIGLTFTAVAGALGTAVLVWFLVGRERSNMLSLVLIGVAVSMFLGALNTWIIARTTLERAAAAQLWLTGSLNGRDFAHAWAPGVVLLGAVSVAGWLAFVLGALALGPATAHTLGHNVTVAQAVQLLTAVVLAAVAVSAAGPIGFVAFVTPQIARLAAGSATPPLVLSALTGAVTVATADLAARALLPWEVPVGIVTALAGAPVLLWMIVSLNRKGH
ncbi:FecCD family ABC transporter permease [Corynebacterium pygosceleis]|uniref:Iron ABC transporter permease n=1 Tax=Corynebacterium pygosceleis TaxID=2800406 RepID=A0A9Q4C8F7_9CORY|nr:iron ABC transporter permease [Corynebacterium pygosceleis]MCK7637430.1 iron ABC transporter permease [Corynebacterium pygosceleis]MCL0119794.1 iron ABC transporter permease [Corynebacterium pygosceleis]MCX7468241.1 iron ABC transporter permease [Corynebacterium pygosceleis]